MAFWEALLPVAGSLLGNLIGGDKASDAATAAADAQADATKLGIEEQRRQFDLAREDQAPYRTTGTAANRRLAALLGIGSDLSLDQAYVNTPEGYQAIYDRLAPKYTRAPGVDDAALQAEINARSIDGRGYADLAPGADVNTTAGYRAIYDRLAPNYTTAGGVDKEALQAEINARSTGQGYGDLNTGGAGAPGELLRRFGLSDLEADPVYQTGLKFGLDQGTAAINERARARGGYDSGATLKELTRYGTDYGSTKANEAFNRFRATQDSIYNKLAGISGTGQVATNQVQAAGTNMANNVAELNAQAGNARAAGIVGGANAWNNALGGISSGLNNYYNSRIFERLLPQPQMGYDTNGRDY